MAINEQRDELALGDVVLRPIDFDGLARGSFEVGGLAANGEAFSFARADGDRLACDVWTAYEKRLLTCRAVYERGALAYLDVVRSVGESPEAKARVCSTCIPNWAPRGPRVRLAGRATAACSPRCEAGGVLAWTARAGRGGCGSRSTACSRTRPARSAPRNYGRPRGPGGRAAACTVTLGSIFLAASASGALASLSLLRGARAGGP